MSYLLKILTCFSLLVSTLFLISCSSSRSLTRGQILITPESISRKIELDNFKAAGTAKLAIDKDSYSGGVTINYKKNVSFKADFYTPFGSVAASVQVDTTAGMVYLDNKTYPFGLSDTMYSLPFTWSNYFTFNDFIQTLTGRIPWDHVTNGPDTIIEGNNCREALWRQGELVFTALLRSNDNNVKSVTLRHYIDSTLWKIEFSDFDTFGLSKKVVISDRDGSYISVAYDRIVQN